MRQRKPTHVRHYICGNCVVNKSLRPDHVRSVAKAWIRKIGPGDEIISFNWDLLHEALLWQGKKWSYVDGYGFTLHKADSRERLTKTHIYKLHGSVNWVQEKRTDEVTELQWVREYFFDSYPLPTDLPPKSANWDMGRKLVLPTYLKDISSNRALLSVWQLAHEALQRATEIFVIGYSLNPADHPARLLLGIALGKNNATREITVVNPSVGEWSDFAYSLGKKLVPIQMKFEEWVMQPV